jgi:hypothetical protein
VSAVAGSRPFQCDGELSLLANLDKRACIVLPIESVEVNRQKKTGLIQEHGINPKDKISALPISSGEMPPDDFMSYTKEALVWTFRTPYPGLFTDTSHPLVPANGRITAFSGFAILKAARVNVLSPPEKGLK